MAQKIKRAVTTTIVALTISGYLFYNKIRLHQLRKYIT